MEMQHSMDEYDIQKLPPFERLLYCKKILRTEKDESLRWDAVWIVGELAEVSIHNGSLYNKESLKWGAVFVCHIHP